MYSFRATNTKQKMLRIMAKKKNYFTEYPGLEGTHEDYKVQLLALQRATLQITPSAWEHRQSAYWASAEECVILTSLHTFTFNPGTVLTTFNTLFQDLLSRGICRSPSSSTTLRRRNWELNWVLLLFVFHVNMEHFGKYTSFNDTQAEKNKLPLKSVMSTKINLLKLVLFKLTLRHLGIHGWSNTKMKCDLKVQV